MSEAVSSHNISESCFHGPSFPQGLTAWKPRGRGQSQCVGGRRMGSRHGVLGLEARGGWPDSLPGWGLSMEASEPALRCLPTGLFCRLTFLRGHTAFVFYVYLGPVHEHVHGWGLASSPRLGGTGPGLLGGGAAGDWLVGPVPEWGVGAKGGPAAWGRGLRGVGQAPYP